MNTRLERFHELMRDLTGEWLDVPFNAQPNGSNQQREPVAWRGDPDPFGMDWKWAEPSEEEAKTAPQASPASVFGSPVEEFERPSPSIPLRQDHETRVSARPRRWPVWRVAWLAAAAALLFAIGLTAAAWRSIQKAPLREESIAAWAADVSSARIAAGPDQSDLSAAKKIDPALESNKSASPSLFAPVAVQEALQPPEIPEGVDPKLVGEKRIPTVVAQVPANAMFYLMFKTPGSEADGTAVVIRVSATSWHLLWEEAGASAEAPSNAFGPIKARSEAEDYLLIAADKTATPLLETIASCLPNSRSTPPQPERWKPRLAEVLRRSGHAWFGLQRVRVTPETSTLAPVKKESEGKPR